MQFPQYQIMSDIEEKHFWYVGMRAITKIFIAKFIKGKNNKILDVGCGTGRNLLFLKNFGNVKGIDISQIVINLGRKKGVKNIKLGSINNIPFPNNTFDLVTCFDVFGHKMVNEKKAIEELYRVLKPNGKLLLRLAAYKWLYSYHDVLVHNDRRYNKKEITNFLKTNKFILLKATYINTFLFPLIVIKRLLFNFFKLNTKRSDSEQKLSFLNRWYLLPLLIESYLVKYINLPFGVSIMVVAKKND